MSTARQERLAKRYAKALFDVTQPTSFDDVSAQLGTLAGIIRSSAELTRALTNPIVSETQRLSVVDGLIESAGGWKSEALRKTVKILVQLRKTAIIPSLSALFDEYVREYRRSLALKVTFASTPSASQLEQFTTRLKGALGAEVSVTAETNPDLLGGVTVRLGDRLLDRSVSGSLNRLADQLRR